MVLTIKQRAFLIEHVFRNGGKYTNTVQKRFFKQFPDAEAPHHNAVGRLIKKIFQTKDVKDATRTGRPSNTNEKAMEIQKMILKNPKKSVRQFSQQAHVAKSTVDDILRKKLHFFSVVVQWVKLKKKHEIKLSGVLAYGMKFIFRRGGIEFSDLGGPCGPFCGPP